MKTIKILFVILPMLVVSLLKAQPVLRATVMGNGGVSFAQSGTTFLGATIGQPIAGLVSAGTTKLGQGFWFSSEEIIGVREIESPSANALSLDQNYPNPFNPSTSIRFSLPEQSAIELNIYDALGHHVKTIVDQTMLSGVYEARFEATGLPGGVYLYELRTRSQVVTRSMILCK